MQSAAQFAQIELTTICNFGCHYCAGRHMPQRHMDESVFNRILDSLVPDAGMTVSLQGEGEPMLHPRFWAWIDAIKSKGFRAYTITNGSRIDPDRCARELVSIGVSIDTLDPAEAERIGRHNLPKVLRHFEALLRAMGPDRVVVHTVHYGQALEPLIADLKSRGLRQHIIQPLQVKDDYARRYPKAPMLQSRIAVRPEITLFRCGFLDAPRMRYFNIDGIEMPCCFIKDATVYRSADDLRRTSASKTIPAACSGCRELR